MPPKGTKGKRKKPGQKKKAAPKEEEKQDPKVEEVAEDEVEEVDEEEVDREAAKAAKDLGNACVKAKDFTGAIEHYTEAIGLDGSEPVYFSNRSMALLALGRASEARADGTECVKHHPTFAKGYGRLGAACYALADYGSAVEAYTAGLKVEKANATLVAGLAQAEAKLAQQLEEEVAREEEDVDDGGEGGSYVSGTVLVIKGLKSAKAAQHNGKEATVDSWDEAAGRYVVDLDDEESTQLRVKPANVNKKLAAKPEAEPAADGGGEGAEPEPAAEDGVSSKCIGIDLGTTNSCVGVWIDDEVVIIPNDLGKTTTPSFVSFDGQERVVGQPAKDQQTRNIGGTIYDAKRLIGQKMSAPGMVQDCKAMQYKVLAGEGDKPQVQVEYRGRKQNFAPEEISAMVLTKMKQTAEAYLGEKVVQAVITVPAYFNDSQRAATKAAGRIAGLEVRRIINEPTAAALAYGLDRTDKTTVLVFDLGGGTFDVSVLTIDDGIFEVVATGGDTRLGGEDFDHALMAYFIKQVKAQMGVQLDQEKPKHKKAVKRLKVEAQVAKEALSSSQTHFINLEGLVGDQALSLELTRETLEKIMAPYTAQAMATVKKVLKDGRLKQEDIGEVVLVGGSTRIPVIQDALQKFFGGRPLCKNVNPDECVAYGAAVQGAILSGERSDRTSALLLVDVTPLSLGVEVEGKIMSTVVKRNTPIPCSKSSEYTTTENFQTSIDIAIYEGERSCIEGNNMLGEFTITGIERAKRGEPKVQVQFDLDANGMLKVSAMDKATGAENHIVITNSKGRLSSDEVDKMVGDAEKFAEQDAEYLAKAEARNELESLIYSVLDYVREQEDAPEGADVKVREEQAWLESVRFDAETHEYQSRARALRSAYGIM